MALILWASYTKIMIYPYTAILHGALAILCFASFFYLIYFKKDLDKTSMRAYFNWFLFFFLYSVLLLLPLIIFNELNLITGRFLNIAFVFLSLAAWQAFNVALNLLVSNEQKRNFFSMLYLIGITIAVILNFIFVEIPVGSANGKWVLWYSGEYISFFYTLFMFIAGWTFTFINLKEVSKLQQILLKIRAILYALAGFILPFSSLYYFGVQNMWEVQLSFMFSISGMTLFAIGNIPLGIILKRRENRKDI